MIVSLTIKDIVLIDRLQMDFEVGLCVLSGETGAGKSILLSSIGLAIGARGGRELIRHGKEQGSVSAEFSLAKKHKIWKILDDQQLDYDVGQLILRRVILKDGRSKAFINDQSVSISLLRSVGEKLIEIHGQHDERGLLNPSGHRALLDDFGRYDNVLGLVRKNYQTLRQLNQDLSDEQERLEKARRDEDYIRHNLDELNELDPKLGEEEKLAKERTLMMQGENLSEGLGEILDKLLNDKGANTILRHTLRKLEQIAAKAPGLLEDVSESLDRAANETTAAISELEDVIRNLEFNPYDLENTEERLFALRAAARKHSCQPDALVEVKTDFEKKLAALAFSDEQVKRLSREVKEARATYEKNVRKLSAMRRKRHSSWMIRLIRSCLP